MKRDKLNMENMEDDLRPEYDLKSLRVRKLGPERKSFWGTVRLEADVAEAFPNAETVNEALRFLLELMQTNQELSPVVQSESSKMSNNSKVSSQEMKSKAAKILGNENSSEVAKKLAASVLSQADSTKQTSSEMEEIASKVLQSPKYSDDTKSLAGSVLSQSNKDR
jgi:methyl-accepting chemotaxis protein